ncbi:MAG: metallophosphoesterase family protein [Thermodesulfobacteriota bacterium]|nr:metallophosphoesterase family protein [Thermodesulfobacteriota bacterium]
MKTEQTSREKIKILTVSDYIDKSLKDKIKNKTHDPVDLILSCGDLPPEYLSFLRDRLDKPLYYIKGNHDIRYTPSNPMGCENIHARIKIFKSLKIMGLEGSMWYSGGPNQYTEKEMQRIILKMWFPMWIKKGIDIIITHAAPRNVHDGQDVCHKGFNGFNKLIKIRKPGYFIHGHIHKSFKNQEARITRVNGTKVVNTCGFTLLEI